MNVVRTALTDWVRGRSRFEASHLQQPVDAIRRVLLARGPEATRTPAVGGMGTALRVKQFDLVTVDGDFYVCSCPLTPDGDNINVAKPPMLRRSLTSHDGVAFTYSSDINRTADGTEAQVIVPGYDAGDEIWAIRVPTGVTDDDGVTIQWLDINVDARGWAAE